MSANSSLKCYLQSTREKFKLKTKPLPPSKIQTMPDDVNDFLTAQYWQMKSHVEQHWFHHCVLHSWLLVGAFHTRTHAHTQLQKETSAVIPVKKPVTQFKFAASLFRMLKYARNCILRLVISLQCKDTSSYISPWGNYTEQILKKQNWSAEDTTKLPQHSGVLGGAGGRSSLGGTSWGTADLGPFFFMALHHPSALTCYSGPAK